jgi:thiamine kinase-like enzyme
LRSEGELNAFLLRYLQHRLTSCEVYLRRDVTDWEGKLERLRTLLSQPYRGEYALVHGDFFPANLLVDEHHRITALLDFGWMTHYGDPLYDLATGWVFFDMYDELKRDIWRRLGRVVRRAVGEETLGILHRYILLYSVLTANAYAYAGGDGHYYWCVGNLNNPEYWAELG